MGSPLCYKAKGIIYFPANAIPDKRKVLKELGVKENTFAGNMISRLYEYYFYGAIDFVKEYRKNYSKEFGTAEDFIEEHFNIDRDKAELYARDLFCMKDCAKQSMEMSVENLIYDRELKELFFEVIGGIEDEDPDGVYY